MPPPSERDPPWQPRSPSSVLEERLRARIAVVVKPAPDEVTPLPSLVWIQSMWAGADQLVPSLAPNAPPS